MRLAVAIVLAVWEPLGFTAVAGAARTLAARGPAASIEFCWAAVVAALSVAAAWALLSHAMAAVTLTRAALVAALARDLQVLCWTALPSNVVPGTRVPIAAASVAVFAMLWAATTALERRIAADR